jgi:hypothetical protein
MELRAIIFIRNILQYGVQLTEPIRMTYTYTYYSAAAYDRLLFMSALCLQIMRLETAYTPNSGTTFFLCFFHSHLDFLLKILNKLFILS